MGRKATRASRRPNPLSTITPRQQPAHRRRHRVSAYRFHATLKLLGKDAHRKQIDQTKESKAELDSGFTKSTQQHHTTTGFPDVYNNDDIVLLIDDAPLHNCCYDIIAPSYVVTVLAISKQ